VTPDEPHLMPGDRGLSDSVFGYGAINGGCRKGTRASIWRWAVTPRPHSRGRQTRERYEADH
jgi:hypothetical protein